MAKKIAPLLPSTQNLLRRFGERLRLARRRRRLTAKQVAERAGMAPMTLRSLERGSMGVTMGAYLAVMQVLGMEKEIDALAKDDPTGRELQDARLSTKKRNPVRNYHASLQGQGMPDQAQSFRPGSAAKDAKEPSASWMDKGGFAIGKVMAETLLIKPRKPQKTR